MDIWKDLFLFHAIFLCRNYITKSFCWFHLLELVFLLLKTILDSSLWVFVTQFCLRLSKLIFKRLDFRTDSALFDLLFEILHLYFNAIIFFLNRINQLTHLFTLFFVFFLNLIQLRKLIFPFLNLSMTFFEISVTFLRLTAPFAVVFLLLIWFIIVFNWLLACIIACLWLVIVILNIFWRVLDFNRLMLYLRNVWRQIKIMIWGIRDLYLWREYWAFINIRYVIIILSYTNISSWLLDHWLLTIF